MKTLFTLLLLSFSLLNASDWTQWDEMRILGVDSKGKELSWEADRSMASFYQLPISNGEARTITKIITTMADDSIYKLLFKKGKMERLGDSIHHVHPLCFLGHIFHNQQLHNCMRTIKRSYFKWNGFMKGVNERMSEEMRKDNVIPHIYGFCSYVNADPDNVLLYVKRHDWEGLAKYLINRY